jgi:hypothetical protein
VWLMLPHLHSKIKFHFNIITLKCEHFHGDLNRYYKIASICRYCPILQNGLQIDDILNVFYFQVMKALKKIFAL